MTSANDDYSDCIVILHCKDCSYKFWNEQSNDWTTDIEQASLYPRYGAALNMVWSIPRDKAEDYPEFALINCHSKEILIKNYLNKNTK